MGVVFVSGPEHFPSCFMLGEICTLVIKIFTQNRVFFFWASCARRDVRRSYVSVPDHTFASFPRMMVPRVVYSNRWPPLLQCINKREVTRFSDIAQQRANRLS